MSDFRYRILIEVTSRYLPERSAAREGYAFAYQVTIHNQGEQAATLLSRHWIITDGNGQVQEVRGAGVLGVEPLILPGAKYTYSSGTLLPTQVGSMYGSYQMIAADGHRFEAPIPVFRLAVPGVLH